MHFVLLVYDGIFAFGALDLAVLSLMKVSSKNREVQPLKNMGSQLPAQHIAKVTLFTFWIYSGES